MSNKTLSLIIIVLILLFAGSIFFFRSRGSQPDEFKSQDVKNYTQNEEQMNGQNLKEQNSNNQQPDAASSAQPQPGQVAGSTANGECQRDFDEQKLKTAKVAIQNRQAQINVKGFGNIVVEFYDKDAPKTVENFLRLTNAGYFDCLTFHRVAKGFVIQGGDPTGTGSGGISVFGPKFDDELNPSTPSYKTGYVKGVLAMANAGPNTNSSQFFILLADQTSWMPHNYTIFGKVVSGQDVVDKIGLVPTADPDNKDGKPKEPVVMESVKIIK